MYIRPQLLFSLGTFDSFLVGLSRNQVCGSCCSARPLTGFNLFRKQAVRAYCTDIYTVGQTLKTCAARVQLDQILYKVAFLVTCSSKVIEFSLFFLKLLPYIPMQGCSQVFKSGGGGQIIIFTLFPFLNPESPGADAKTDSDKNFHEMFFMKNCKISITT